MKQHSSCRLVDVQKQTNVQARELRSETEQQVSSNTYAGNSCGGINLIVLIS